MDIQKNVILTGTQQFRYELLQWCGGMEDAKKAYAFIMGADEKPEQAQLPKANQLEDGVYLVQADGKAILFAGDKTQLPSESETVAIGLKMGDFSIKIALYDEAEGENITLTTKANTDTGQDKTYYIDNCDDAVADMDGVNNTDHLRNILNPEIKLADGWYIPSLGELYRIFINKKIINEALDYIHGDKLQDLWYWTSAELSATYAWSLGLYNGLTLGWYTKASYAGRVRAVSAFKY